MPLKLRAGDVAAVGFALLLSFVLFDLFPGPTTLLGFLVGGMGVVATKRRRPVGRRLLTVCAGMVLAAAVLAALALARR